MLKVIAGSYYIMYCLNREIMPTSNSGSTHVGLAQCSCNKTAQDRLNTSSTTTTNPGDGRIIIIVSAHLVEGAASKKYKQQILSHLLGVHWEAHTCKGSFA